MRYFCRELSLLEFNRRVVLQAENKKYPPLERLRFLCIASSNLDEFFEVRVALLHQRIRHKINKTGNENYTPGETLKLVTQKVQEIVCIQYCLLRKRVLVSLKRNGVDIVSSDRFREEHVKWVGEYFRDNVNPLLTPVALDGRHPAPRMINKRLNFAIPLSGKDIYGRKSHLAILHIPKTLPRILHVPRMISKKSGNEEYILLSSIILKNVQALFPGMRVKGCYPFKITMDSNIFIEEDMSESLLEKLKNALPARRHGGENVRLEVGNSCPTNICDFLMKQYQLKPISLYRVNGPVNLARLLSFVDMVKVPKLKFSKFSGCKILKKHKQKGKISYFKYLKKKDILLHHPYDSFSVLLNFLRSAAEDRKVFAIRQTAYRIGERSELISILEKAARAGKEVQVVIELSARFDEETNINIARRLHSSGVKVSYGVLGHKTHSKMLLVARKEGKKIQLYTHLGTGNYHEKTAKIYTDLGLITSDRHIGEDVHNIFMQVTSLGKAKRLNYLYQSPVDLHGKIISLIRSEAQSAKEGKKAKIMAKMNQLTETKIIDELYEASQCGVEIFLNIRGECRLIPQVKGMSERIHVRSIIGRFLEHSRVCYFYGNGEENLYCGSADWMTRNFFHRVETLFPIHSPGLKKRIIKEIFEFCWADNCQSWLLQSDGSYVHVSPGKGFRKFSQQSTLLDS